MASMWLFMFDYEFKKLYKVSNRQARNICFSLFKIKAQLSSAMSCLENLKHHFLQRKDSIYGFFLLNL